MGVINEELDLSIDSIDNGTADTTVDNGSDTTTITNPPAPKDKGSNEGNNQQSSSTGKIQLLKQITILLIIIKM